MALLVFRIGGTIALDAIKGILDLSLPLEQMEEISRICRRQPGVVEVEYCRGRSLGATRQLNIQLAVDERLGAEAVNTLVAELDLKVRQYLSNIAFLQISTTPTQAIEDDEASALVKAFMEANDA
ncbi:MAG: hypothetical protein HQL48_04740 [Gammaproteobacteria bacterium]|nr:hypothetical protein [Gammaproteobacteria bacterium]